MRLSQQRLLSLSLALLASSCSLVVDGVTPPGCTENVQCEVLNTEAGIDSSAACELFQCNVSTGFCQMQARDNDRDGYVASDCVNVSLAAGLPEDCNDNYAVATTPGTGIELCNGRDDDCDGVIDEAYTSSDASGNAMPPSDMASRPQNRVSGTNGAGNTLALEGQLILGVGSPDSTAQLVTLSPASESGISLARERSESLESQITSGFAGCHLATSSGVGLLAIQRGECNNFADLAVGTPSDLTQDGAFVVSVETRAGSCAAGVLRAGWLGDASAGTVTEAGPLYRSNVFWGADLVDVGMSSTQFCSGKGRKTADPNAPAGAARPNIAATESLGRAEALTVYLGDEISRPACGGPSVNVEGLGLVQESDADFEWVNATNAGTATILGTTTAGGRPAIIHWENQGYLVAFGNTDGVNLVLVDDVLSGSWPAFDRNGSLDMSRPTPDLTHRAAGTLNTTSMQAVNNVAMAAGSIRTGGRDFGIVWREGCLSGSERLVFRQIRMDNETQNIDEAASFAPVVLAEGAEFGEPDESASFGEPHLVYAFSGFLEMGSTRDGQSVDNTQLGGWYVIWPLSIGTGSDAQSRVYVRRISEMDGQLLSPNETIDVTTYDPNTESNPTYSRAAVYRESNDQVHFAFHASGADQYVSGPLSCLSSE